ncbi:hypothetical protein U9M48_011528 [Paspalum notatum var. saurae]|uniref:Uncharacterized protein n=1 Tax=Paspalum notatum var. saurae TaxID=547442 RepID=A0AAQ3SVM8_PASNO
MESGYSIRHYTFCNPLIRSTSKSTGGKTPYELWTGAVPAVHHLRTFGCVADVKVTTPNLKKLDDRSHSEFVVEFLQAAATSAPNATAAATSTPCSPAAGPASTTSSTPSSRSEAASAVAPVSPLQEHGTPSAAPTPPTPAAASTPTQFRIASLGSRRRAGC